MNKNAAIEFAFAVFNALLAIVVGVTVAIFSASSTASVISYLAGLLTALYFMALSANDVYRGLKALIPEEKKTKTEA